MKLPLSLSWSVILIISILFVLGGCTVEKRLYQQGYHVEWHKRARSGGEAEAVTGKHTSDQIIQPDEKSVETITASAEEKTIVTESETPVRPQAVSQVQDEFSTEAPTISNTTNTDQPTEALDQTHEKQPLLKKMSKREGGPSGVTKGLLMILMGLLLILMGFLFQNILGVFGTILLIIFGLGGTIMIVVGIVIMILG